ncbi:hypothetical protein Ppa06_26290 [Planomonospora parontospora subsp. parontospora]|uniref:Uncharacterized protein n=2 Tax=Planomonospora parontospora TaxID=58119 RepID=A0AA37F3K7_9ACTN|nr:hypothetical protein [Planomonospora parontospora]GGK59975.1 hypothetical protein GCM10010126_19390 [Planomonospora parontospora]GII08831.1 hypothetical protein Ppa06_26290 [Planomonospora parontospora subsp. parontospora]
MTISNPLNHGVAFPRPGDGQAQAIPCTCPLVEFTVKLPAFEVAALEAKAAHDNTTVQDIARGRLSGFGNAYPLNQDLAYRDPCKAIQ